MKKKFGEWLTSQIEQRNTKPADFARMSGLDTGSLSNLMNSKRMPTPDTCKAIAKALEVPLEVVYRAADILPEKDDVDIVVDSVVNLMRNLEVSDKEDILAYVKLRHRLADQKRANKSNSKRSPKFAPTQ